MNWIEIDIDTGGDVQAAEIVAQLLQQHGMPGCWLRQDGVTGYLTDRPQSWAVLEGLEESLRRLRREGMPLGEMRTRGRHEDEWSESWKRFFHVRRVGRLVVRPSWERYDPGPGDLIIDLDPGIAFGTGTHPTTELCLLLLQEQEVAGAEVIDVGTGSGILSILAARLGAADVAACDLDPVAVEVASSNAAVNGVGTVVGVIEGGPEAIEKTDADILLCNITAEVLCAIMPTLVGKLRPGGRAILSGIVEERLQMVVDAASSYGMRLEETRHLEGWAALLLEKTQP